MMQRTSNSPHQILAARERPTATPALADAAPTAGIVWAHRFAPDGTATPIPNESIYDALRAPGTR